jgi:hypothetical protein
MAGDERRVISKALQWIGTVNSGSGFSESSQSDPDLCLIIFQIEKIGTNILKKVIVLRGVPDQDRSDPLLLSFPDPHHSTLQH